jgi:CotH kinase protein
MLHKMLNIATVWMILGFVVPSSIAAQVFVESTLPIVLIDTDGPILDEPKTTGRLRIIYNGPNEINHLSDVYYAFDGKIGIETRGQTSQLFSDKKPYGFETLDDAGVEANRSLLGMPKESDWILLAPYTDKSLLRDVAAFGLGARFDWMDYTPRAQVVEVMVNGNYRGIYILTEKIKRNNDRVPVERNVPSHDVTGGYIIKIDKGNTNVPNESWASHIQSNNGGQIRFLYHYPAPEKITQPQMTYIQGFLRQFEDVLRSPQYRDPVVGYQKYIDTESFIDYMLHTEVTRNVDGYRISTFLYKDRDSIDTKLHMGPVWDFNIALGNADYCDGGRTSGWAWDFNRVCPSDYWFVPFWWERLLQDSAYVAKTKARWTELRATTLSDAAVTSLYDSLSTLVSGAPQQRNFERWPIMGTYQWPNAYVGATWQDEYNYLKRWTLERLAWMDDNIHQLQASGGSNTPIDMVLVPRVLPNPARSQEIIFEMNLQSGESYHIQVFDMNGREVADTSGRSASVGIHTHVLRHQLTPGTYSWRVEIPYKNPAVGKVVVVK